MGNRIVIDLNAPRPKRASKTRRWPRVLAVLGLVVLIVVVVVAVAGFVSWRYYQSTPTYTLALMIDAAQRNDVNWMGTFAGCAAQVPVDASAAEMLPGDLETGRQFGQRVAAAAERWKK